jgi:two-component system nitrogen regulation response regulator GlnG
MTYIALDIPAASQRLALRRWLEARGHEICPIEDPRVEVLLAHEATRDDPRLVRVPLVQDRPDFETLGRLLGEQRDRTRQVLELLPAPDGLIAHSQGMRELLERIRRLAAADLAVLITGESGSGKEVVARALHDRGPRADEPFVAVNCAAIPEGLFESELFGHERGSFTDASDRRYGHFERAGAGTLFLDEIAEIPTAIQPKLLRALQEHRFHRVGGEEPIEFRARIVSAAAFDLDASSQFRADLYHRIAGARVEVPPLRERSADLPDLCRTILARTTGHAITGIDSAVIERLADFDWPGNVRQLENVMRQAAILSSSQVLELVAVEPHLRVAGRAESRALDQAIRAWATRRRAEGLSSAELREDLLERLRSLETDADSDRNRPARAEDDGS